MGTKTAPPSKIANANKCAKPSILNRGMLCGKTEILFVFAYTTNDKNDHTRNPTATEYHLTQRLPKPKASNYDQSRT